MKRYYVFVVVLVVISLAAVVAQGVLGSGARADRELSDRITALNERVQAYYGRHDTLPARLSQVESDGSKSSGITYRVLNSETYELCATFRTENRPKYATDTVPSTYINATNHKRGVQCFTGATPTYAGYK
jgi:type II secretory pathway pseudopilin PulG